MNMVILNILPFPQHILELVTKYPGNNAIEVLFLLLFKARPSRIRLL